MQVLSIYDLFSQLPRLNQPPASSVNLDEIVEITQDSSEVSINNCNLLIKGDGFCNASNNFPGPCNFDGGDCCRSSCEQNCSENGELNDSLAGVTKCSWNCGEVSTYSCISTERLDDHGYCSHGRFVSQNECYKTKKDIGNLLYSCTRNPNLWGTQDTVSIECGDRKLFCKGQNVAIIKAQQSHAIKVSEQLVQELLSKKLRLPREVSLELKDQLYAIFKEKFPYMTAYWQDIAVDHVLTQMNSISKDSQITTGFEQIPVNIQNLISHLSPSSKLSKVTTQYAFPNEDDSVACGLDPAICTPEACCSEAIMSGFIPNSTELKPSKEHVIEACDKSSNVSGQRCMNLMRNCALKIAAYNGGCCDCEDGWYGPRCDTAICENECIHGICIEPDICVCDNGWWGESCEIKTCYPPPIYGFCTHNGVECLQGWSGPHCDIPLASSGCINGLIIAPNICFCSPGWIGLACDIPLCDGTNLGIQCGLGYCTAPGECSCQAGVTYEYFDNHIALNNDDISIDSPGYDISPSVDESKRRLEPQLVELLNESIEIVSPDFAINSTKCTKPDYRLIPNCVKAELYFTNNHSTLVDSVENNYVLFGRDHTSRASCVECEKGYFLINTRFMNNFDKEIFSFDVEIPEYLTDEWKTFIQEQKSPSPWSKLEPWQNIKYFERNIVFPSLKRRDSSYHKYIDLLIALGNVIAPQSESQSTRRRLKTTSLKRFSLEYRNDQKSTIPGMFKKYLKYFCTFKQNLLKWKSWRRCTIEQNSFSLPLYKSLYNTLRKKNRTYMSTYKLNLRDLIKNDFNLSYLNIRNFDILYIFPYFNLRSNCYFMSKAKQYQPLILSTYLQSCKIVYKKSNINHSKYNIPNMSSEVLDKDDIRILITEETVSNTLQNFEHLLNNYQKISSDSYNVKVKNKSKFRHKRIRKLDIMNDAINYNQYPFNISFLNTVYHDNIPQLIPRERNASIQHSKESITNAVKNDSLAHLREPLSFRTTHEYSPKRCAPCSWKFPFCLDCTETNCTVCDPLFISDGFNCKMKVILDINSAEKFWLGYPVFMLKIISTSSFPVIISYTKPILPPHIRWSYFDLPPAITRNVIGLRVIGSEPEIDINIRLLSERNNYLYSLVSSNPGKIPTTIDDVIERNGIILTKSMFAR